MLTDHIRLTDTPGYEFIRYQVPEAVSEAVSSADMIIMMFTGFADEADMDLKNAESEEAEEIRRWLANLTKEEKLLKELLAKANTRDIYFVIPFDSEYGIPDQEELERDLARAKERFASFSDHGEEAFFRVDPMMALIAAIEDDHAALEKSGVLPLKAALMGTEG